MATFFFRAVASDGKVRSGSLPAQDEKFVARELRKQGLTPIYVGMAPKGAAFEIKLPRFVGGRRFLRMYSSMNFMISVCLALRSSAIGLPPTCSRRMLARIELVFYSVPAR